MIILKTLEGTICGGYTSKSWDGRREFTTDSEAFVFNMTQKYGNNNPLKAIYTWSNGFMFGNNVLRVSGDTLNKKNKGWCWTGKNTYYDIASPLTNQTGNFTCAELEVYKVVY